MDRVFRLSFDPSYQSLQLADPALLSLPMFHFDSTSRSTLWQAVDLTSIDSAKPEPDFWKLADVPNAFVCNERVFENLPILWAARTCEPLPVRYNDRMLWLGNVTEYGCYDALDIANSLWPSGINGLGLPSHYAFYLHRLGPTTIFTVPETCEHELLLHTYCDDPVYEFKAEIKQQKLTGLQFEEIWRENR